MGDETRKPSSGHISVVTRELETALAKARLVGELRKTLTELRAYRVLAPSRDLEVLEQKMFSVLIHLNEDEPL